MDNLPKSTTIFVDNLPHQIRKIWVFNLFSRYGKIRDLYIPNTKKSKITGQDFGFVRFLNLKDAEVAIAEVNNKWYWGYKLTVKFARFLRKIDEQGTLRSINIGAKQNPQILNPHPKLHVQVRHQFQQEKGIQIWRRIEKVDSSLKKRGKEIWRRKGVVESSEQGRQRNLNTEKSMEPHNLSKGGTINVQPSGNGWLHRSAIAKISRLASCKDLEYVFRSNGIQDIQIRAIGGRYVIISFPDKMSRDAVINQRWLGNWFEEINPWMGEHAKDERFVWLSCFGMPLNAWSYSTFKDIGNKWGNFLMVDESTLKENSFVNAKILIATDQIQLIHGHLELIVENIKYHVRIVEDETFRSIENSLFPISSMLALEKKDAQEEDDDVETSRDERAKNDDVEASKGAQVNEVEKTSDVEENEKGANSTNSKLISGQFNEKVAVMDVVNSSLGTDPLVMGNEKSMGSSNSNQSPIRGMSLSDEVSTTLIMESQDLGNVLGFSGPANKEAIEENPKITDAIIEGINEEAGNLLKVAVSNHYEISEDDSSSDPLDQSQAPVHSAMKGLQGKKKRKNINDILGFSKVKSVNRNLKVGGSKKNKCVVLRSAVAAAALSASISSNGINNRNKILLDEAQAIWAINKMHGISYEGDEQEVVSKIANLDAQVMRGTDCHL